MNFNHGKKIGFIGAGNMTQSIINGLFTSNTIEPKQILVSSRSEKKLQRVAEDLGIKACGTNEELVELSDIIFLATKPQDLLEAIENIAMSFDARHVVISIAAGISIKKLQQTLSQVNQIARIMPNTPIKIQRAVIGYCVSAKAKGLAELITDLLSPLGLMVPVTEGEMFEALTVASGSGTGFVLEFMSYWTEWLLDYGFDLKTAREITTHTFLGAAQLADTVKDVELEELQNQVVSKKGVTAAGLDSIRELDLERGLRISFEKAILRDRELGLRN